MSVKRREISLANCLIISEKELAATCITIPRAMHPERDLLDDRIAFTQMLRSYGWICVGSNVTQLWLNHPIDLRDDFTLANAY